MDESISSLHTQTTQLQVVFLPPKAHIQIDQSYSSWAHAGEFDDSITGSSIELSLNVANLFHLSIGMNGQYKWWQVFNLRGRFPQNQTLHLKTTRRITQDDIKSISLEIDLPGPLHSVSLRVIVADLKTALTPSANLPPMASPKPILGAAAQFKLGPQPPTEAPADSISVARACGHQA
ncbi:hypothetical protein PSHT_07263 [Puccinia striiformis]|uniref:Uncharacterized protein n=1 Tax=Puccinia striiformis TaxID=27350 RepID=A0A2S4VZE4_9BASI|nr:hypothetical protein PSHT_07263 [Puccinia striiformis]